jgi:cytochrome c biogenesis protein CcmG, thiol:disulfide interchange protein DsbE
MNAKLRIVMTGLALLLMVGNGFPQGSRTIPDHIVKTLDGRDFQTSAFDNDGKPYVLSFWATWCRPCLKELNAIADIYEEWKDMGFKVIAVSTDDARTRANILPMVNGRGWEYEFYHDENGDFRRTMGVNMVPHTFIINGKGEIVSQHTSFADGMEWEMFDKLMELLEKE